MNKLIPTATLALRFEPVMCLLDSIRTISEEHRWEIDTIEIEGVTALRTEDKTQLADLIICSESGLVFFSPRGSILWRGCVQWLWADTDQLLIRDRGQFYGHLALEEREPNSRRRWEKVFRVLGTGLGRPRVVNANAAEWPSIKTQGINP